MMIILLSHSITLSANNDSPIAASQFQVINGGEVIATGNYGSPSTTEWSDAAMTQRFLADGTTTYTLTIRDADTNTCVATVTTVAENECSICPATICQPVNVTIKIGRRK